MDSGMIRFLLVAGGFSIGMIVVTSLLHLIRVSWIKYVPTVILGLFTIAAFLQAKFEIFGDNEGMADLAAIVSGILFGAMALVGLVTCLVLDKFFNRK
jgi:hypothetical protein